MNHVNLLVCLSPSQLHLPCWGRTTACLRISHSASPRCWACVCTALGPSGRRTQISNRPVLLHRGRGGDKQQHPSDKHKSCCPRQRRLAAVKTYPARWWRCWHRKGRSCLRPPNLECPRTSPGWTSSVWRWRSQQTGSPWHLQHTEAVCAQEPPGEPQSGAVSSDNFIPVTLEAAVRSILGDLREPVALDIKDFSSAVTLLWPKPHSNHNRKRLLHLTFVPVPYVKRCVVMVTHNSSSTGSFSAGRRT